MYFCLAPYREFILSLTIFHSENLTSQIKLCLGATGILNLLSLSLCIPFSLLHWWNIPFCQVKSLDNNAFKDRVLFNCLVLDMEILIFFLFMHPVEVRLNCKKWQYSCKWNEWTSDIKAKGLQQHWPDNLFAILFGLGFLGGFFVVVFFFLERIIACSKAIYIKCINWDLVVKLELNLFPLMLFNIDYRMV